MKRALLIDGSSLIFRAFYAIRELTTKDGIYTNGVYGFLNMYFKLIEEYKPDYVMVAFDRSGPTFRKKDYDLYKANRKETPSELASQFGILKNVLDLMGIKQLDLEGYEADDIVGTLSEAFSKEGIEQFLVTGDRDYLQLVDGDTRVILTKKGISDTVIYDLDKIKEDFGLEPKQLIEVKGLMGDASDNIPGVSGIGEKTALKLINQFGSIENIYENLDKLSGKALKQKLEDGMTMALMSRKLGEIFLNAPIDLKLDNYIPSEPKIDELIELFEKLEFKSFIAKLGLEKEDESLDLDFKTENLDDSNIKSFIDMAKQAGRITFKFLYEDDSYIKSKPFLLGLKLDKGPVYLLSLSEEGAKQISLLDDKTSFSNSLLDDIFALFEDEKIEKIACDIKGDLYYLYGKGIETKNFGDLTILSYLIDPSQSSYSIEREAFRNLSYTITDIDSLRGKGKKRVLLSQLDRGQIEKYLAESLIFTQKFYPDFREKVKDMDMLHLYKDIELPLVAVLAKMELTGFKLDVEMLKDTGLELDKKIKDLEKDIYLLAGIEFNISSPKQLAEVLFDKLNLPVIKKTKTGYSTDVEVLEELSKSHDIASLVLEYRSLTKLKSTYVDGLLAEVDQDGRVRSNFKQTIAQTGRISSTEPNLQNIPQRSEEGRKIRRAFVADEGNILIDADYSQIELRVLAHLAADENMISAFEDGVDIHTKTASEVFDIPLDEVTSNMRSNAKAVNFGIVYGISDFGLSRDLKISRKEAKEYIDGYLASYPKIKDYMKNIVEEAKDKDYVETIHGRRRYVPELKSKNMNIRNFGERIALNTPIQGSAADIIKIAMVRVEDKLRKENLQAKLILQVHDELIIESPIEEEERVKEILKSTMEGAAVLAVKLIADINTGRSWYESK